MASPQERGRACARREQLIRLVSNHAAESYKSGSEIATCECDLCKRAFKELDALGWASEA